MRLTNNCGYWQLPMQCHLVYDKLSQTNKQQKQKKKTKNKNNNKKVFVCVCLSHMHR